VILRHPGRTIERSMHSPHVSPTTATKSSGELSVGVKADGARLSMNAVDMSAAVMTETRNSLFFSKVTMW
jgi:hypothetical protein